LVLKKKKKTRTELNDPTLPWRLLASCIEYQELARIAIEILTMPSGIAGVERSFSALRRIHTWQRAMLGPKTVDKLQYIYINLRWLN